MVDLSEVLVILECIGAARNAESIHTPPIRDSRMYTLQTDSHGNRIVCKGDTVRNGYRIVAHGTYAAMLAMKVGA